MLLLIAPFFILSFFVFPSADDYSNFNLLSQYGFWGYQKHMYLNWAGRYTANFFDALSPVQNISGYRLIPVFQMVILLISLFTFFNAFLRKYLNKYQLILFSLVVFILYLNIFPSPGEGLFWFPASKNYLLANSLTLFFLGIVIRMMKGGQQYRMRCWIMALLLAFFIIGLNELSLLLICGLLLLFILGYYYILRKPSLPLLFLFVFAVCFALIEILAPGNYVRMSLFSDTMNFGQSIINSMLSLAKLLGMHFQNMPFVLLSALVIPFVIRLIQQHSIRYNFLINPVILAIFSLLSLIMFYIPCFLMMGINPPMRINAMFSLIFIIIWFVNILNLCHYIYRKRKMVPVFPDPLMKILLLCTLILSISDFYKEPGHNYHFRSNIPQAYYDLFLKAGPYKIEMNKRLDDIRNAKAANNLDVSIDELKVIPNTIFFVDISSDSSNWINHNYAKYYGLTSIRLKN